MSAWIIAALVLFYFATLFLLAGWAERNTTNRVLNKFNGLLYSLALAVYCSSWTYYGAVGTAVRQGWQFIAIFLGPIILFLFAQPFLFKLFHLSKKQNVTSVTDFIAARYGKRRNLALITSILCLIIVIPYIALQLKAVASSYHIILGSEFNSNSVVWWQDSALLSTAVLTSFAIWFGTRKLYLTEQRRGVMLAIAFGSVIKLFALLCLALVAYWLLLEPGDLLLQRFAEHAKNSQQGNFTVLEFAIKTCLAMVAVFILPWQFHVTFIEKTSSKYLQQAKPWFCGYLIFITLAIMPIALTGIQLFPNNNADNFVLLIPSHAGWNALSTFVFIGGFAAATSMIIVASLALSNMITNDMIMPSLLRVSKRKSSKQNFSLIILWLRRSMIFVVMALSYFYYDVFARNYELAETGLVVFALAVQLAPAVIGGLYWRRGNVWGVYAGLSIGFILWFFTLMLPQLVNAGAINSTILNTGLFGWHWFKPSSIFALELDNLSHGVLISVLANSFLYFIVSLVTPTRLQDRLQAVAFVKPNLPVNYVSASTKQIKVQHADLMILLEQFLGVNKAKESLVHLSKQHALLDPLNLPMSILIEHVERELAGVIGSSSASTMVNALVDGRQLGLEDVVTLFDDTSQAIQFSRKVLFTTLENLSQGISVIDAELKLIAWNKAYLTMFDYPAALIKVGRPIADIVRFNAQRGMCGDGDVNTQIEKRLKYLQAGTAHVFQRVWPSGQVVEMRGNPIQGGGFVTSFTDITAHVSAVKALAEAKQHLEDRVQERTQTISQINEELLTEIRRRRVTEQQLLQAKIEADAANASKTRFLALASHDILQPLNAARLFTAALENNANNPQQQSVINQLDNSLKASEELIATLLDIAKLDDGNLTPEIQTFSIDELINSLVDGFSLVAKQKNLALTAKTLSVQVLTDATYLRRILQNLVSNALKYTVTGRVFVSCRKRGDSALIQVWDTGPGISDADLKRIFDDFYRVDSTARGQQGVGLGLGVVQRMARLLNHKLSVNSVLGKGSVFSIELPIVAKSKTSVTKPVSYTKPQPFPELSIVCIDDDDANLTALTVLLKQWQINNVVCFYDEASFIAYAKDHPAPDILILDYQLAKEVTGLSVYEKIQPIWGKLNGIIVSASPDPDLAVKAKKHGLLFLAKPIKPAALRASLNHLTRYKNK